MKTVCKKEETRGDVLFKIVVQQRESGNVKGLWLDSVSWMLSGNDEKTVEKTEYYI